MNRSQLNSDSVSVIIPTHNRKEWLVEAIHSVIAQTVEVSEIIVVDDNSSEDIVACVKESFPAQNINVIRNTANLGPGASRNIGVSKSSGKYIAFLDSDDIWVANKIEKQLAVFHQLGESIGFVGGGCDYMNAAGEKNGNITHPPSHAGYEDFIFQIKMPGSGSNNLILKSAFDEVGGFKENLKRAEDKHLWLKLLKSYQVGYVPEVTATIRIHSTERLHSDERITLSNRLEVDSEIENPTLRKKAEAFSYYAVFLRAWTNNKIWALSLLLRSFIRYPWRINSDIHRVTGALRKVLNR